MQVEVAFFACSVFNGLQTITSAGLGATVPSAVFFGLCGGEPPGSNDVHAKLGGGAADGTRQWAVTGRSQNSVSTMNTHRFQQANRCLTIPFDSTDALSGEAEFDAFVAGGVRINWIDAPPEDYDGFAIFFAGTDVTAYCDEVSLPAEDVELVIADPGFKPKTIIAMAGNMGSGANVNFRQTLGFAALNGAETDYASRAVCFNRENGIATSISRTKISSTGIACQTDDGPGEDYDVEVTNPTVNGFSFIPRNGDTGSDTLFYLAIEHDELSVVFDYDPPTSTGADSVTGLGITPQALLLGSTGLQSRDTAVTGSDATQTGMHAVTVDDEVSLSHADQHNQATSDTKSICTLEGFRAHNNFTSGYHHIGTLTSLDADGFTANFTTADATQRRWIGIAFEQEPVVVNVAGQVSFAELEVPDVKEVGEIQVAFAELRVPNAAGDGVGIPIVANKRFNEPRLREELDVFGLEPDTIDWNGFVQEDEILEVPDRPTPLCYEPFGLFPPDGRRGEMVLNYSGPIDAAQIAIINSVIAAHDCGIESATQANDRQRAADLVVLRDFYSRFNTLTDDEKDECHRLVLRLTLQDNGDVLAIDNSVDISFAELEVPDP